MATEVRRFAVTIPAGTLASAPQVTNLSMPPRVVTEVDIRVPPGPAGLVGFALGAAGQVVVPYNTGGWIITDNETINWKLDGQITSGAWQLIGYNTGLFAHTIYVAFLLDLTGSAAQLGVPSTIPVAQLAPVPAAESAVTAQAPAIDLTGLDVLAQIAATGSTAGAGP